MKLIAIWAASPEHATQFANGMGSEFLVSYLTAIVPDADIHGALWCFYSVPKATYDMLTTLHPRLTWK